MIALALALAPPDFYELNGAIDKCERNSAMPIFAGEAERRSAFATSIYSDQAAISAERIDFANRRRTIRESGGRVLPRPANGERVLSDQTLSLMNLALDDRQRALDDRRRLETMREAAIDLTRRYFLARCASTKDDLK
ncbi:MAG: hypothetical protein NVS3B5_18610 [Sphingomicrobium sp.]